MSNLQSAQASVNKPEVWTNREQSSTAGGIRTPDLPPEPNQADCDEQAKYTIQTFQAEEDQIALDATLAITAATLPGQANLSAWRDLRREIRSRVFGADPGQPTTTKQNRDLVLLLSLRFYIANRLYEKPDFDAPNSIAGRRRLIVAYEMIRRIERRDHGRNS